MRMIGLPPDRCDSSVPDELKDKMKLRKVSRGYVYGCHCGKTFNLTSIRHNRIQSGRNYICPRCQGTIVFKGFQRGEEDLTTS